MSQQQLTPNAANIVAGYFTLNIEEQASIFGIISKTFQYSPPPPHPFPLFSPIPFPPTVNVWKNQDTTCEEEVREEKKEEVKNVRDKKRQNHNTKTTEYALEPITDYCIQVCEKEDGCACRYKANSREQRNDVIPELNLNGIYVFGLRRDQGYIYITERAGLKRQVDDNRVRLFGKQGVAYVTLESHEQAVEAYKNLRMNGVRVNWQKKDRNQKREEEENSSGESREKEN